MAVVTIMVMMPVADVYAYEVYTTYTTPSQGFSKSWQESRELFPLKDPAIKDDWGVCITYGYSKGLFTSKDYVQSVGGQPTAVESCGYVQNSKGKRQYTGAVTGTRLTGKVTVTHTGADVRYGVVICV